MNEIVTYVYAIAILMAAPSLIMKGLMKSENFSYDIDAVAITRVTLKSIGYLIAAIVFGFMIYDHFDTLYNLLTSNIQISLN